jgi:hypothetical protein
MGNKCVVWQKQPWHGIFWSTEMTVFSMVHGQVSPRFWKQLAQMYALVHGWSLVALRFAAQVAPLDEHSSLVFCG